MQVLIELTVNVSDVEELLKNRHDMSGEVRLTGVEFDESGDLVAFSFDVEAEDSVNIDRFWGDLSFAEGLVEDAI
jgi:hypothetical protein